LLFVFSEHTRFSHSPTGDILSIEDGHSPNGRSDKGVRVNTERLIVSIGAILLAARVLGWIFQRIGQPRVVGEMTAGIVLGPSLLGQFLPGTFAYLFPASSMPALTVLSQLGLLLFMFVVGLEVDLRRVLNQRAAVLLISNASIVLPLALGIGLATALYPHFAGEHVSFSSFALFVGTAMSVTAFPVLARILKERNLLGTELGTMAISCAAIDDVSAWVLLAVLTAMVHSTQSWHQLALTLLLLVVFVALMLVPVRRAMFFLLPLYRKKGAGTELISSMVLMMLAASWMTERLGVHALFGAFMAGLVMPKNEPMIAEIVERIESLSLALLMPLFFALTGLRTRVDLLTGKSMWGYTAAIVATAVVGKFAGAALTGKATGMNWNDSLGLGVLMNTRGLVELVILNAGLDLGILSPALFTMMVIMALVTTFMTSPILMAMKTQPVQSTVTG
jgi:Kef-type K+ transport system membrane component KefB